MNFQNKLHNLCIEAINHISANMPSKGRRFGTEKEAEALNKKNQLPDSKFPKMCYNGKHNVLDVFIVSIGPFNGGDTKIRLIVDDEFTANKTEDGIIGDLTSESIIHLADHF